MNELIQATLERMVEVIETGTGNWLKDWIERGSPVNFKTRKPYHGINILMLWAAGQAANYPTAEWATYKQWSQEGFQVTAGARSTVIFIAKDAVKKGGDRDNPDDHYRMLRCAYVFNAAQLVQPPPVVAGGGGVDSTRQRLEQCERTIANTGAIITEGPSAAYRKDDDTLMIPPIDDFISIEGYYVTVFHELIHWTGHADRLDRPMGRVKNSEYAFEELVAEFGGAFLCAEHGISEPVLDNSAAYIRGWLQRVDGDKGIALMKAASAASKACELITKSRSPLAVAAE